MIIECGQKYVLRGLCDCEKSPDHTRNYTLVYLNSTLEPNGPNFVTLPKCNFNASEPAGAFLALDYVGHFEQGTPVSGRRIWIPLGSFRSLVEARVQVPRVYIMQSERPG